MRYATARGWAQVYLRIRGLENSDYLIIRIVVSNQFFECLTSRYHILIIVCSQYKSG